MWVQPEFKPCMCFACLLVGVVDYLLTQLPPLPTSTQSPSSAALASSTLSSVSLWLCIHVLWLFTCFNPAPKAQSL